MGNLKCSGLCVGDRGGVRRWCDTLGISYANLMMFSDNFKSPTVIRGSPLQPFITQTTTVWKGSPYNIPHTITVYTTGKQLSGPHVYQGFPL